MTILTKHFSLEELTISETAVRRGWSNTPPPEIEAILRDVTAPGMERVRTILGDKVISVSSGYRSPKVNAAVGSKPTSAHPKGYAVDFNCFSLGRPLVVAKLIESSDLEFDQLIHEFGSWVHISFEPRPMRGQVLTIDALGTRTGLLPIRQP